MPRICGKRVNILGKRGGKTSGVSSTVIHTEGPSGARMRVQLPLLHILFPRFALTPSTLQITHSPLAEHYFYPVSTAPITTVTKEKIKER